MLIFGAAPRGQTRRLYDHISALGLTSNLKLCLDASDRASYPGSGTKWLDTSGGGYDFDFGDGSTSSTYPTFNGTAGGLSSSEYFSLDGGDFFTYDSANESWMKSLHKSGQAVSVMAVVRIPSDNNFYIVSTEGPTASELGFAYFYSASFDKVLAAVLASTTQTIGGAASTITTPRTMLVGMSFTVGSGNAYATVQDGVVATGNFSSFTPSSADSTGDPMRIGSRSSGHNIAPSGTRIYELAVWQGTELTSAQWSALFGLRRAKYGL